MYDLNLNSIASIDEYTMTADAKAELFDLMSDELEYAIDSLEIFEFDGLKREFDTMCASYENAATIFDYIQNHGGITQDLLTLTV